MPHFHVCIHSLTLLLQLCCPLTARSEYRLGATEFPWNLLLLSCWFYPANVHDRSNSCCASTCRGAGHDYGNSSNPLLWITLVVERQKSSPVSVEYSFMNAGVTSYGMCRKRAWEGDSVVAFTSAQKTHTVGLIITTRNFGQCVVNLYEVQKTQCVVIVGWSKILKIRVFLQTKHRVFLKSRNSFFS